MAPRRVADSYGGYRSRLVEQLRQQGIEDLAVLRAFGEIPRHLFVPDALRRQAYEDTSLPIGMGQTISQPGTQAVYLQALELRGPENVLEIGTGSGYQTALLTMLAARVVSVERLAPLVTNARQALTAAGVREATVVQGDGTLGWRPLAPYDAILVTAAGPAVPDPLVDQLAPGGRLVMPLARGNQQVLVRLTRDGDMIREETLRDAQFVPLIGRYGYRPDA